MRRFIGAMFSIMGASAWGQTPTQNPVVLDLNLNATANPPRIYERKPAQASAILPTFDGIREAMNQVTGKPLPAVCTRYEAAHTLATFLQDATIHSSRQMALLRGLLKSLHAELIAMDFPLSSVTPVLSQAHIYMLESGKSVSLSL